MLTSQKNLCKFVQKVQIIERVHENTFLGVVKEHKLCWKPRLFH